MNKFYPDRVEELSERLQSTYGKPFVSPPPATTYYMIEDEYDLFVRCSGDRIVHRDAMSIVPKSLNITRGCKAQMLLSILERLEKMDQSLAIDVVKVVLRDFSRLCSQSKTFRDRVAEMKFVPDVSGIFRKPSELYVELVRAWFLHFSHTKIQVRSSSHRHSRSSLVKASSTIPFDSSLHLATLTHLGLANKLSPDAVLASAHHIAKEAQSDDEIVKRGSTAFESIAGVA